MKIHLSPNIEKGLKKLPRHIQRKAHRQFSFLIKNYRHPSLQSKKMKDKNKFEARIDYHNRFTFTIDKDTIKILSIGPHNHGLGKK